MVVLIQVALLQALVVVEQDLQEQEQEETDQAMVEMVDLLISQVQHNTMLEVVEVQVEEMEVREEMVEIQSVVKVVEVVVHHMPQMVLHIPALEVVEYKDTQVLEKVQEDLVLLL